MASVYQGLGAPWLLKLDEAMMDGHSEKRVNVPEHHPIRRLFRILTGRALDQERLRDRELLLYLSNMLVEFIHVDSLYRLRDEEGRKTDRLAEMLRSAEMAPRSKRKDSYRYIGDYSLFILGMFPEWVTSSRRAISQSYYTETGRTSYLVASGLEADPGNIVVLRKLADHYESCVSSLNWVCCYVGDSFYQYMFREFDII